MVGADLYAHEATLMLVQSEVVLELTEVAKSLPRSIEPRRSRAGHGVDLLPEGVAPTGAGRLPLTTIRSYCRQGGRMVTEG